MIVNSHVHVEFHKTRMLFRLCDVATESSGQKVSIIHALQQAGILCALVASFPNLYTSVQFDLDLIQNQFSSTLKGRGDMEK